MTNPIEIKNLTIGSGMPKVCVPLTSASEEALLEDVKAACEAGADLVEWRADFYEALSDTEKTTETLNAMSDILGQIPLLFTIRTEKEGGKRQISAKDYVNYNKCAAASGKVDLIDIEVFSDLLSEEERQALMKEIQEAGVKVIASYHDFDKTDDREALLARFREMDKTGADILKMAVMPKEFDDVAAIMQVTSAFAAEHTDKPLIGISMGNTGSMSRFAGENFHSSITFATVGKTSAPGQIPILELRMMMDALHAKNAE